MLISFTEYRPYALTDLPGIARAADRLTDLALEIEGAVGLTTYFQPRRLCVGSLSAWTDEDALREFIAIPYHVTIMKRYRDRGHLRASRWSSDTVAIGAAFVEGERRVDAGEGRKVGEPAAGVALRRRA